MRSPIRVSVRCFSIPYLTLELHWLALLASRPLGVNHSCVHSIQSTWVALNKEQKKSQELEISTQTRPIVFDLLRHLLCTCFQLAKQMMKFRSGLDFIED